MADGPDLSEFYRLSAPRKKPCRIGHALGQLKPAEREQLEAALAADKGIITGGAIEQWLAARGHKASGSSISSHRRELCTCHDPE